jgi:hypothetical protein
MTSTTVVNAQTLSTTGAAVFATKTTLQATTVAVELHAKVTPGTSGSGQRVKGFLAISPFSLTADEAPNSLKLQAVAVEIYIPADGKPSINKTEVVSSIGATVYAYTWFEVPALSATQPTLDATLTELS